MPTKIAVAIDFGTVGIAAAYALLPLDDPRNIHTVGALAGTAAQKAPTRVELSAAPPHRLVAFGHAVSGNQAPSDTAVFHRFKMLLYSAAGSHSAGALSALMISASAGDARVPALTVFSRCLRAVKDAALEEISKLGFRLADDEFMWVITVPAIWSDAARTFMREAAIDATLITKANLRQLAIALEPECAAIDVYRNLTLSGGAKAQYMVVDAGGGTIDVTVHELERSERSPLGFMIHEIYKASGNDLGGTAVDKEFLAFLKELLPSLDLTSRACENGGLYELMTRVWEEVKTKQFGQSKDDKPVAVSLIDLQEDGREFDLGDAVATYNRRHPGQLPLAVGRRSCVLIPNSIMMGFFERPLKGIRAHLNSVFAQPSMRGVRLKSIILVGGFAHSSLLQDVIKEVAGSHGTSVYTPPNPQLRIVSGAVVYGALTAAAQDSGSESATIIGSRRSRFTYGIGMTDHYAEGGPHPASRKKWDERLQKDMVPNVLRVFAVEGDKVLVDSTVEHVFAPLYQDQASISFQIVASPSRVVKYTDDAASNVFTVGTVEIPVPALGDRNCKATMRFGTTEIEVTVHNAATGSRRVLIDFHHSS